MSQSIVLGKGYVGSHYCQKYERCFHTNRKISSSDNNIYFDLLDKDSWKNLPQCENVIWTFAAANNKEEYYLALEFFKFYCVDKKTLILSTTSAYLNRKDGQIVDENSPLDLSNNRIKTEEELRQLGACILHLAGIFGPNRDPKNWYLQGRIHDPNGIINLIHVDDVIFCMNKIIEKFKPFERYNASNGFHKENIDIINELINNNEIRTDYKFPSVFVKKISKRISNKKILEEVLPKGYQFMEYP